ncbi:MAG: hypothetical protein HY720_02180 [Planctomycetes bacterium]|nr:hypothetical protein [Planctomycetota bacterium]
MTRTRMTGIAFAFLVLAAAPAAGQNAPTIEIVCPRMRDELLSKVSRIEWIAKGADEAQTQRLLLKIEVKTKGGEFIVIADKVPNTGVFDWDTRNVPADGFPNGVAFVLLQATDPNNPDAGVLAKVETPEEAGFIVDNGEFVEKDVYTALGASKPGKEGVP